MSVVGCVTRMVVALPTSLVVLSHSVVWLTAPAAAARPPVLPAMLLPSSMFLSMRLTASPCTLVAAVTVALAPMPA